MTLNQTDACLTAESMKRLAHGEFQATELAKIEQHVGACEYCRDMLDSPTRDAHWHDEVLPVLQTKTIDQGRLSDLANAAREVQSFESELTLLGPTDDPHKIGRIGSYEVIGVIGRGGMGVVFKALDVALNRFVAIKMLLPHLAVSGAARKRFAREGQAAAAVLDDNVLPIYSVSEWQGVPYFVMQYSRGTTLQTRIQEQGPLALVEILRIGMQTARGLAAAHAQGLVHRDVKPSNILLDGDVERVLLSDFGLARAVDDASLTRTGVIAGTPQYMSPEQVKGDTIDSRSDLFSLGCVLYALCTGRPPFRAENSYAILRQITDHEPRSIRELNPDIPDWFVEIISKLMAKSPGERFASAAEVAEVLEQCLAHVQQPQTIPLPVIPGHGPQVSLRSFSLSRSIIEKIMVSIATLAAVLAAIIFAQLNGTSTPSRETQSPTASVSEGDDKKQPAKVVVEEKSAAVNAAEVTPPQASEAEKVNPNESVDVLAVLEMGRSSGSVPKELVIRIGATMGESDKNAPGDAKGQVEFWEFTNEELRRVQRYIKGGKPVYYRLESCKFDSSELCKDLIDGQAIEIQARNGTGPNTALAGTHYQHGSRTIELEWNGQKILDLHETTGPIPEVYRESDAKAFGNLYERLARQARWLLGPGVGEISKLQWQSSGVASKVDSIAGSIIYLSDSIPDGLNSKPARLVAPRYGVLKMGPTGFESSFFIIVESPAGHPATLYVNRKGDGEMSEEVGHSFTSERIKRDDGSEGTVHYSHVSIDVPFADGKREANIKFSRIDPKRWPGAYEFNLLIDADFGYSGTTTIDGRPVSTVIIDNGCTGELKMSDHRRMEPRIWFDFNANGVADPGEVVEQGLFAFDGKWWSVESLGNDGTIRIVQAFQRDSKPTDYSEDAEAIKIWLVGNPHDGDTPGTKVPDVLKAKAKELGFRLNVKAFKAEGFHNLYWESLAKGEEPDVLVHDCNDILDGVETDRGTFTGIAEKQGVSDTLVEVINKPGLFGGAALLVTSSHNHTKVKELISKYEPTPLLPTVEDGAKLPIHDKVAVSNLAIRAYRDMAKKDVASLKKISDEFVDMSNDWGLFRGEALDALPGIVEVLDVRGTNRLAFVVATTPFSDRPLMFVFRRSTVGWKLSTVTYKDDFMPSSLPLMSNANDQEMETQNVERPLIFSPSDGAKLERYPELPNIEWITSGDLAVAYLVEAKAFEVGALYPYEADAFKSKDVIKVGAPFGVGAQPHRWRVWAIGPFGDAAISEWRTINYTN